MNAGQTTPMFLALGTRMDGATIVQERIRDGEGYIAPAFFVTSKTVNRYWEVNLLGITTKQIQQEGILLLSLQRKCTSLLYRTQYLSVSLLQNQAICSVPLITVKNPSISKSTSHRLLRFEQSFSYSAAK